jgi:hypothetical protein
MAEASMARDSVESSKRTSPDVLEIFLLASKSVAGEMKVARSLVIGDNLAARIELSSAAV